MKRSLIQRHPRSAIELHYTVRVHKGFVEPNPSNSVSAYGIQSKPGFHGAYVLLSEFREEPCSFVELKQGSPAYLDLRVRRVNVVMLYVADEARIARVHLAQLDAISIATFLNQLFTQRATP